MSLLEKFRDKVSKIKDPGAGKSAEFDVMYSTGFLSIDYLNGTTVYVESKDRNFKYNSVGIVDGSANTIIGRSGSGKSTLIMQICGNIVRPFIQKGMDAELYIDDIEGSLPEARKFFLLGLTNEQYNEHVDLRNDGITTENVLSRITTIRNLKVENKKEYEYDTGLYDMNGERIFKLIPTVYVIDSLPLLLPKDVQEDDSLGSNMTGSSVAKQNTLLVKKIVQLCKEANIILFTVNHINDDIQMGFIPKAAQISGLKQGERLPGGRAALYLANNMFRVDDSRTLKESDAYGIDGSIVTLTLIKSRTNASKRSVPLIFNKTEGKFDEILSLFELLKQEGAFSGAGAYQYLDDCPDIRFSQKTFKETIENSPELQKAFASKAYSILVNYLSDTKSKMLDESNAANNVMNMFNEIANKDQGVA